MVATSAERAKNSKTAQALGRAGMVCYGLVHVILAYLAVRVAFGSNEQADQKGAIQEVGSTGFGAVLLWVLTVGLIAYGLWQFSLAATGFRWVHKHGKRIRRRIGAVIRGIFGISLGIYAARLVTQDTSGGSGDEQQQEFTAKLLSMSGGQILVGIVAAIVIGFAVAQVRKGLKQSFLEDLDTEDLPSGTQQWVKRLGVAGYCAKGVVVAMVGVLIGIAAFRSNPNEAGGLDRALKILAAQPFGTIALVLIGAGLAAFGVYCFAAARAHKS